MNGPRTNQFVAPTSFITSISRRREKIESRIVFAISSIEAISSTITAIEEHDLDHPGDLRIRFEVCCPSLTVSTPANFCVRRSAAIAFTSSAVRGRDLERGRQRVRRQVRGELAGTSSASA